MDQSAIKKGSHLGSLFTQTDSPSGVLERLVLPSIALDWKYARTVPAPLSRQQQAAFCRTVQHRAHHSG